MIGPQSYIFRTVARLSSLLINGFALYVLWRGHDRPGGGFVAGLATGIAFILLSLAVGLEALRRHMRFDPARLAFAGLALATLTGTVPLVLGRRFLEQFTFSVPLPLVGELHLGTPLLFDLGVYLVVVGITCKIIFVLGQSTQGLRALVEKEERLYSSVMERPIEEAAAELTLGPAAEKGTHAD